MATKYKSGSWSLHGRVMPGCRTAPKVIDQILNDGSVIQVGTDQTFKSREIEDLLLTYFPEAIKKGRRLYVDRLNPQGRAVCFYTRNINHLGGNWSSEKKRIQIGTDFPELYENNLRNKVETVLLGVYHYYHTNGSKVKLFVCFSSKTYASRETNNSAAHVHTIDLMNAYKNGVYRRLDRSGNEILVLNEENFIKHINGIRGSEGLVNIQKEREILDYLGKVFDSMPKHLDGIKCYEEMMTANDGTRMRQAAWEGWYCEFYLEKYLKEHPTDDILWWSKKGEGELDFDLKFTTDEWFYGDVKSDAESKSVQGNLKDNIDLLVKEKCGRLWYVAIEFKPYKDSDYGYETTKWWNNKLGKDNPMSYCTRMKHAIDLLSMDVFEITADTIKYLKVYSPSPCQGKPRREKYCIPNNMKEFLRIDKRVK